VGGGGGDAQARMCVQELGQVLWRGERMGAGIMSGDGAGRQGGEACMMDPTTMKSPPPITRQVGHIYGFSHDVTIHKGRRHNPHGQDTTHLHG
jgi:hypothetical protein